MAEITSVEIFSILLCFFASGFFSGSEAVLLSIGADRANQLISQGGKKAEALNFMIDKPNELLTTILVGNNIANIMVASLNTSIAARIFESDAIGISVGFTTIFILIFGEIIPKTFARTHAEAFSYIVIKILQALYYFPLWPAVTVVVWCIEKMLGENSQLSARIITKKDLEFMLTQAEKNNSMDSKQLDLLNSIMEFPKIKVKDIMIARSQVKFIEKGPLDKVTETIKEDQHSRYPVCSPDLDHTLGFLHIKDLAFLSDSAKKNFDIKKYLKPSFFVYEHMKIQAVFDHMNKKKVHLALVKDENGLVVGIVTLEDIIEEIFGEILDEHDVEDLEMINSHTQDQYKPEGITIDGMISLRDLYSDYDIKIPLNDNYSTLTGFLLDMLGNTFPEFGQIIVWEGYSFELKDVEGHEIKEVKIKTVDGEKHIFSKRDARDTDEVKSPTSADVDRSKNLEVVTK